MAQVQECPICYNALRGNTISCDHQHTIHLSCYYKLKNKECVFRCRTKYRHVVMQLEEVELEQIKGFVFPDDLLLNAAKRGLLKGARRALEKGANMDATDRNGDTPLMWAAYNGYLEMVKYLVSQGARLDAVNNSGRNALQEAEFANNHHVVRYLLAHVNPNASLLDSVENGLLADVVYALEKGADTEATDKNGATALILAARSDRLAMVRYLIEKGADIEARDEDGDTPLIWAAYKGHLAVVQYLVNSGANIHSVNHKGESALQEAKKTNHRGVVRYLSRLDPNEFLLAAAEKGLLDHALCALEKGADIEARDNKETTALMFAASRGHLAMVNLLVNHGANIHSINYTGESALQIAKKNKRGDVVQYLKACGAKNTH